MTISLYYIGCSTLGLYSTFQNGRIFSQLRVSDKIKIYIFYYLEPSRSLDYPELGATPIYVNFLYEKDHWNLTLFNDF